MRDFIAVTEIFDEVSQEIVADFAEEGPDGHIKLIKYGLLFPPGQDALDDDDHEENFNGQVSDIAQEVDVDVMRVLKNQEVDIIQQRRDSRADGSYEDIKPETFHFPTPRIKAALFL
jgi:hypothetical protein